MPSGGAPAGAALFAIVQANPAGGAAGLVPAGDGLVAYGPPTASAAPTTNAATVHHTRRLERDAGANLVR